MPALEAGPSAARLETSTPRSSFRLRALARSGLISSPPIPRYPPLAFSTTYPCAARPRGVKTWANAVDETRLAAAAKTIPRLVFIALPLPLFSNKDGTHRGGNLQQRSAAIDRAFGDNQAPLPAHPHGRKIHRDSRSEEHTSELQSPCNLVCRLLLVKTFVANMNPTANELGMTATYHAAPAGLSPSGYSAAQDLSIITRYALQNPGFRHIFFIPKGAPRNTPFSPPHPSPN